MQRLILRLTIFLLAFGSGIGFVYISLIDFYPIKNIELTSPPQIETPIIPFSCSNGSRESNTKRRPEKESQERKRYVLIAVD